MRRRAIVCLAGIFAICLLAVCMLWYGGRETGGRLQKRQEEYRQKRNTGQWTGQEAKQKIKQPTERVWIVEEDVEGSSMGRNLSWNGHYLLEEGDCLFAAGYDLGAGTELYGGKDVPEKENHTIYQLKDDVWEVFISHPPESVNNEIIQKHNYWDEVSVKNLIYQDGFLYYCLLYDDEPGMGGDKPQFIYRIPVQGGEAEELAQYYDTFCIYNRKIYYLGLESKANGKGEYVYWEMEPDGTERRAIYRREVEWRHRSFTVGGGCLFVEEADGEGITGIKLKTGDMRYYKASWSNLKRFYYESGYLYIWVSDYGYTSSNILRMDVVSGEKEQLGDHVYAAWLEKGYLYYIWYNSATEKWSFTVIELETGQSSTETLGENGTPHLQTVGDDLVISIHVYKEQSKEKEVYFRYKANTMPLDRMDRKEVPAET